MAAPAPTYDTTYLTEAEKVRGLAAWILSSSHCDAAKAREAMGIQQCILRSTEGTLRIAIRYLFNKADDNVLATLIRTYAPLHASRIRR